MPAALKLKIEYWPLSRMRPFERNPRIHGDEQIRTLVDAINLFGFLVPLLVDGDGELIAGHGRFLAARRAGLDEVPVIQVKHLTDAQRKAFIVADNRLANMARWDERLLHELLTEVQDAGIGTEVIGFSDEDMRRLADDLDELLVKAMATFPPPDAGKAGPTPPAVQAPPVPASDRDDDAPAAPTPAPPAADARDQERDPETRFVPFGCTMEANQREVVFEAIRRAKDRHGLTETGAALFAICQEWNTR